MSALTTQADNVCVKGGTIYRCKALFSATFGDDCVRYVKINDFVFSSFTSFVRLAKVGADIFRGILF